MRSSYNTLVKRLRRDGYAFETLYSVEPNPRGTGHHAHAWQHGSKVASKHLNLRAAEVGFGHVDQVANYDTEGYAYGMKMAFTDRMPEFLALNGGSPAHATRGFWRDGEGGDIVPGGFAAAAALYSTRKHRAPAYPRRTDQAVYEAAGGRLAPVPGLSLGSTRPSLTGTAA